LNTKTRDCFAKISRKTRSPVPSEQPLPWQAATPFTYIMERWFMRPTRPLLSRLTNATAITFSFDQQLAKARDTADSAAKKN
jgi:hypothetical protein